MDPENQQDEKQITSLIPEYCDEIIAKRFSLTVDMLKKPFDLFTSQFDRIANSENKWILMDNIVTSLIRLGYEQYKLIAHELIDHSLFVILRDQVLTYILCNEGTYSSLQNRLFAQISHLVMNLSNHLNQKNIEHFKKLYFHREYIDGLASFISRIVIDSDIVENATISHSIFCLLKVLKNMMRLSPLSPAEYQLVAPIYDSVIKCLSSPQPIIAVRSLEKSFKQNITLHQRFMLQTLPYYIQWYSDEADNQVLLNIIKPLLEEFTSWFLACTAESYIQAEAKFIQLLNQFTLFLIRPVSCQYMDAFNQEFHENYNKLASHWSSFLSVILSSEKRSQRNGTQMMRILIQNLYNFTLHSTVLHSMKSIPNLVSHLLEVTRIKNDEIQLNVYRCLSKIMVESDIKSMTQPGKIVDLHIDFLKTSYEDCSKAERFSSVLESLKNFVQHDQVKSELVEQRAVPLLIEMVLNDRLDQSKTRLLILEILLALSFYENAFVIIRNDQNFMSYLRTMKQSSDFEQSNIKHAVEGLLWKLDNLVATRSSTNSYKYDVMISYSHRDKNLCTKIQQRLIQDGFRTWFDQDCLRGLTMAGIAEAIENSQHVLICMSDKYKQSVYCQSEAHYAYERRCQLIPIIVESKYQPDGWLGFIVSGRIYVDFIDDEFETAYQNLKEELQQARQENIDHKRNTNSTTSTIEIPIEVKNLPPHVKDWTVDDVRNFFRMAELHQSLYLICTGIDGARLWHLSEMCFSNRESMFQSLKFELNQRVRKLLTVVDYLNFLHQIHPYLSNHSNE